MPNDNNLNDCSSLVEAEISPVQLNSRATEAMPAFTVRTRTRSHLFIYFIAYFQFRLLHAAWNVVFIVKYFSVSAQRFFFVYACLCSLVAHCSLRSEDNNRHRLNSCFCQTGKVEIFVLCGAHWVKCSEEYYQSHEQSSNTWHSFYCDFEGGKKRDLRCSARKVSNAKLHSALCSFWRFSNSACNTFFVYNRWQ